MDDLYREVIIDRYRNPQFQGKLDPNDYSYHDDNPVCGDHIRMDALTIFVGLLPRTAVYSFFGDSLTQDSGLRLVLAVGLLAVCAALGVQLARRISADMRSDSESTS